MCKVSKRSSSVPKHLFQLLIEIDAPNWAWIASFRKSDDQHEDHDEQSRESGPRRSSALSSGILLT